MNKIFYFLAVTLMLLICQSSYPMDTQGLPSDEFYLLLGSNPGMTGDSTDLQIRADGSAIEIVTSGTDGSVTVRSGRVSEASITAIESAAAEMLKPVPNRPKICPPPVTDAGSTHLKIDLQGQSHTWIMQGAVCTAIESQRLHAIYSAIDAATKMFCIQSPIKQAEAA